ncbi:MAG: Verru_Chthon cassette protein C [Candidatus Methylacidiphilales bacterium]|nr:Verru_Chthon cassette protein C [Candidatus Methylacidiphilales bacterium]
MNTRFNFNNRNGFTIVELLVSMLIMSVALLVLFSLIEQTSTVWRRSSDKMEAFQNGRAAFDLLTRSLSQATLNTYLDYDNITAPTTYLRKSDLRFLVTPAGAGGIPGSQGTGQGVFFQATANRTDDSAAYGGMDGLLTTCGFYVEFGSDAASKPSFVTAPARYRYRLMQLIVPTENNRIYAVTDNTWFTGFSSKALPVADNVIALILRPQDPGMTTAPAALSGVTPPNLTANYTYNSAATFSGTQPPTSNQLPPLVHVTMVVLDESSAKRLENGTTEPTAIKAAMADKFTDPAQYAADIDELEKALNTSLPPLSYRIFTSVVPIRESKWTK